MFAKVFEQILDSSLAEDWQVRHVFEDLLKLCDSQGIVDSTPEAIARRTNTPIEIVTRALLELQKPDRRSRSKKAEGARIVLLDLHRDWGYKIVNFLKYRQAATSEMLRMSERERKRVYRLRHSGTYSASTAVVPDTSGTSPGQVGTDPDAAGRERDMSASEGALKTFNISTSTSKPINHEAVLRGAEGGTARLHGSGVCTCRFFEGGWEPAMEKEFIELLVEMLEDGGKWNGRWRNRWRRNAGWCVQALQRYRAQVLEGKAIKSAGGYLDFQWKQIEKAYEGGDEKTEQRRGS